MANLFEIGDNFAFDGTGSDNDSVINMRISNSTAKTVTVDLFHTIQADVLVGSKVGGAIADEALNPFSILNTDPTSSVFFTNDGNLVYRTAADTDCTVSLLMSNFTYRDFFNVCGLSAKKIKKMRIGVSNQSQIQQGKITVVEFTDFGKKEQDPINLSTFFSPNQFQTTILDVPLILDIDRNKGIQMSILSGITVTVDFFLA
jgi:hypothetical protein